MDGGSEGRDAVTSDLPPTAECNIEMLIGGIIQSTSLQSYASLSYLHLYKGGD